MPLSNFYLRSCKRHLDTFRCNILLSSDPHHTPTGAVTNWIPLCRWGMNVQRYQVKAWVHKANRSKSWGDNQGLLVLLQSTHPLLQKEHTCLHFHISTHLLISWILYTHMANLFLSPGSPFALLLERVGIAQVFWVMTTYAFLFWSFCVCEWEWHSYINMFEYLVLSWWNCLRGVGGVVLSEGVS